MEYKKCLVELDEVLKYLDDDELKKIPHNIINTIKLSKDKEYKWNYDTSKKLEEQNLNRKTIAMLSYINIKYLLNKEQKELMEKYHEYNEKKAKLQN